MTRTITVQNMIVVGFQQVRSEAKIESFTALIRLTVVKMRDQVRSSFRTRKERHKAEK